MLSLKLFFYKLFHPSVASPNPISSAASKSAIFPASLPICKRQYTRACCFGRRDTILKVAQPKMVHRVEVLPFDQTMSSLSVDEYDENTTTTTFLNIPPPSEKGFTKISGSKLTWHGEAARSLDEWCHLNSASSFVPLSPISLWEDTDVDDEDEDSFDWFGETPPVVLTTGSNSIFLRRVLPGLKALSTSHLFNLTSQGSHSTVSSPVGLAQRIYAWFGR